MIGLLIDHELLAELIAIFGIPGPKYSNEERGAWWHLEYFDVALLDGESTPLFFEKNVQNSIKLELLLEKLPNEWRDKILFNLDLFR